jgi:tellurite methyltransferase
MIDYLKRSILMRNLYEEKYSGKTNYWGITPSPLCLKVLSMMPFDKRIKLIDIGCGEGRNAIFFARNGYEVTAFDSAMAGVEKTKHNAEQAGVQINVFQADLNEYRLKEKFDVIFSLAALHYIRPELKKEILDNYRDFTNDGGLNAHAVILEKPFIPRAPDAEETAYLWRSGEIFSYYGDWQIEHCEEGIFDCNSSGVPHKHAFNRIIAKKV